MKTTARYPIRCIALAISSLLMASAQADNAAVTVNVDANAGKHPISPYIYGVAFAPDGPTLTDLNAPLNRYGGNTTSTYNWLQNASNHANDFYFESIPEDTAAAGGLGDSFITTSKSGGAQSMITIPMLDWMAKLGTNRSYLWSYSQAKYGAQTGNDAQYNPDAGNGILASNNQPITTNDPNDANTPSSATIQKAWVQHLVSTWGLAASGGLQYYILDNEHSIWQSTHQDTHPVGPKMTEISGKMIAFSNMIKSVDPGATVIGPEEWGWEGYFYSGFDQQYTAAHGYNGVYPDRAANGNLDYMPWLLQTLHQYDVANNTHILDVFSLHYYPQGDASGDQEFSDDNSSTTQLLRNKSTRSLWDPAYVDASWESQTGNGNVMLIPRMKTWVSTYYPGLKTAITEYNWGDEANINGATTQADIYGIFGREGLDYATRWTTPLSTTPTYLAMKMYRNYDGSKHGFGDNSVSASAPNPDNLSAFAATRSSDGALTVMVVSKVLSGNTPVTVNLANFAAGSSAQEWQLTSTNAITQLANVPLSSGNLSVSVPAQSVSLFVVPSSGGGNIPPTAVATATPTGGIAPLTVIFNSSGSTDSDGSIAAYHWDFGDGIRSASPTPHHPYTTKGNYIAKLTVTDNLGATGSATVAVTVTDGTGPITAPSNLTAQTTNSGKVALTWQDNSNNEQGFAIQRLDPGAAAYVEVGRVAANTTRFVQTGVAAGIYRYRVNAYNTTTGLVSHFSNAVAVKAVN